jgi:hypothetical protein
MSSSRERMHRVILREILKEKIMKEESVSVKVFTMFTIFGFFFAAFNNSLMKDVEHGLYGPASIIVWSYLTVLISLCCILLVKNITQPSFLISNSATFSGLATIFLLVWIVSMNLKYFKKINMDIVPISYSRYSQWTSWLLAAQSFFIFITMDPPSSTDENKSEKMVLIKRLSILNNLIIFLSFIMVLIQQIILDKFSVDVL